MTTYKKVFNQYRGFLVSILIVIVIVTGVIVGFFPAVSAIATMRASSSEISSQLSILSAKAAILDSIDEATYKQYLSDLALAVPTDKSLTSLFSTIDGLSQETGVSLSDFTLVKPGSIATVSASKQTNEEKKAGSNFLPFSLTVTGTYDQIRNFVEKSIGVRRFFRVRAFSINFTSAEIISVQMGMDAYYAPLPTSLGSSQQAIDPLNAQDETVISKIASMPVLGTGNTQISEEPGAPVETTQREDPFSL